MRTDLLLVNPGVYSGTRIYGRMLHEPTMGLLVLRDWLIERGFSVDILDGAVTPFCDSELLAKCANVTAVGFYALHTNMSAIYRSATLIKGLRSDTTIIVGGPNYPAGKAILEEAPPIDLVVKGDGEIATEAILGHLTRNRELGRGVVPGLLMRAGKEIVDTGPERPGPKPSRVVFANFSVPNSSLIAMKMISARGCPNRCRFCSAPPWQEMSTIDECVAAMECAYGVGVHTFYLADENFSPPSLANRAVLLSQLIKQSHVLNRKDIRLKVFLEPHTPLHVLERLTRVASVTAFVGFENFSDDTLRFLGKNTNQQRNRDFWHAAERAHVNVIPGIIALHPLVTPSEVLDLIEVLAEHNALSWRLLLKKLDLYPATPLLIRIRHEFPWLLKDDFSPHLRPWSWTYQYDKTTGTSTMSRIEDTFTSVGGDEDVKGIYSAISDLAFFTDGMDESTVWRFTDLVAGFTQRTRVLASKIVLELTRNCSELTFLTLVRSAIPEYLNSIRAISDGLLALRGQLGLT